MASHYRIAQGGGCYFFHSNITGPEAALAVKNEIKQLGYDVWSTRSGSILKGNFAYQIYYSPTGSRSRYCGVRPLALSGSSRGRGGVGGLRPGIGGSVGGGCWYDPQTGASVCR